jgi:hypothetical protein
MGRAWLIGVIVLGCGTANHEHGDAAPGGPDGGGARADGAPRADGPDLCNGAGPSVDSDLSGVQLFPADNWWNTPIDTANVDPMSDSIIATYAGAEVIVETAMPINVTCGVTPSTALTFTYDTISDPGPYPITTILAPMMAPMGTSMAQESGPCDPTTGCSDGKDHHLLVYDKSARELFEIYNAYQDGSGAWHGASGAIFDTTSNTLRGEGYGSSDAAGLPVIPGLVRCDEVAAGAINHALRFTLPSTKPSYVHPATHFTHTTGNTPMGAHFRLKSSFDESGFSAPAQTILTALKKYGMFVADNGTDFGITGETSASCWVDLGLSQYSWGSGFYFFDSVGNIALHGSDFEVTTLGTELTIER